MKATIGLSSLLALSLGAASVALTGCSSQPKWEPDVEQQFYGTAVRQLPPQPVYNRLRLVYLPEPLPQKDLKVASLNKILPIFRFELKDGTIEEASRVLAETARYTSYCSSIIADRKFSFEGLGTIDELASSISKRAGVNVVVDHGNREVRFLANGTLAPAAPVQLSEKTLDSEINRGGTEATRGLNPTSGGEGAVKPKLFTVVPSPDSTRDSAATVAGSAQVNAEVTADEHKSIN